CWRVMWHTCFAPRPGSLPSIAAASRAHDETVADQSSYPRAARPVAAAAGVVHLCVVAHRAHGGRTGYGVAGAKRVLVAGAVWYRYRRGTPYPPNRSHGRRAGAAGGSGRGRTGTCRPTAGGDGPGGSGCAHHGPACGTGTRG